MLSQKFSFSRLLCCTALLCGVAQAGLVGVTPDFPLLAYDSTGVTNYNAATNAFTIDAQAVALRLSPTTPSAFVLPGGIPPSRMVQIRATIDESGSFVSGAPGDDFVVMGEVTASGTLYSGTLLTGEIVSFGFEETGTTFLIPTDLFDFRIQITGGALAPLYSGRDIAMTVTVEMSTFNNDFNVDFTGGAKGNIGGLDAICALSVEAQTCILPGAPPPPPTDNCRGRVQSLTMRYTGDGCAATEHSQGSGRVSCGGDPQDAPTVRIKATNRSNPDDPAARVWFNGTVNLGETFVISASAGGASVLSDDTYIFIFNEQGCQLQCVRFRSNCCEPLNVGDQFGASLLITIRSTEGGEVTLPEDPEPGTVCLPFIPLPEDDNCRGRVKKLELQYTGDDCNATMHMQASGSVTCNGDPQGAPFVHIIVSNRSNPWDPTARVWFEGDVALGGIFEATATAGGTTQFGDNTWVFVIAADCTILQTVKFVTNCCQPLNVGNQFGSVRVVGLDNTQGGSFMLGADVLITYTVRNGSTVSQTDVVVTDNFGEVPGSPISSIPAGGSVTLTRTIRLLGETTVTVNAVGDLGPNVECTASATATVDAEEPPPPPPQEIGDDGCTPGYWKNHLNRWVGYRPTDSFNETFGVVAFTPDITLNDAIRRRGGGINALARHATAALLNAAHPDVDYALTEAQILQLVQSAVGARSRTEQAKNTLADFNEAGCPLSGSRAERD